MWCYTIGHPPLRRGCGDADAGAGRVRPVWAHLGDETCRHPNGHSSRRRLLAIQYSYKQRRVKKVPVDSQVHARDHTVWAAERCEGYI